MLPTAATKILRCLVLLTQISKAANSWLCLLAGFITHRDKTLTTPVYTQMHYLCNCPAKPVSTIPTPATDSTSGRNVDPCTK
jgi:hypothetical protein